MTSERCGPRDFATWQGVFRPFGAFSETASAPRLAPWAAFFCPFGAGAEVASAAQDWLASASVGIFDIEHDGIASDFTPMLDDAEAVIAGGHHAGEIHGADFEVFGDGDGLGSDRGSEDPGNDNVLVGLQNVARVRLVIGRADRVGQF